MPSAGGVSCFPMRARPSRFLLPAVVVAGAALAFGSSASDTSDGERSARAALSGEHQLGRDAGPRSARSGSQPRRGTNDSDANRTWCCWCSTSSRATRFWTPAGASTRCATQLRRPRRRCHLVQERLLVYDSTTKAVPLILDGMRPGKGSPRTAATTRVRSSTRSPAADTAPSAPRRPPRSARRGSAGGLRSAPAGDPSAAGPGTRGALQPLRPRGALEPPPDPLGEARAAPARPVHLPPVWRPCTPAPRDLLPGMNGVPGFHDAFLTRHNEQRYLLQRGSWTACWAGCSRRLQAAGDVRPHADGGDRGPRLLLAGGRGHAPQREPVERRGARARCR